MSATAQQLNAVSREVQAAATLMDTIFKLKQYRAALDSLGVSALQDGDYVGDLDHLTRQKLRSALAAMDVLDAALLTPADLAGVTEPPIAAIIGVIR